MSTAKSFDPGESIEVRYGTGGAWVSARYRNYYSHGWHLVTNSRGKVMQVHSSGIRTRVKK